MVALIAMAAWAALPSDRALEAQLETIRADVADEVQLSAFDLVDELVYGWTRDPVFASPTPVVLAGVTVPVGLGTALQAMVEDHLAHVLLQNPESRVQLVHCPACTQVVVHSGPDATVVTRGIDDPAVLEQLGARTGQHALFVDIEAEGTWLVLRARLTRLTPELPIVWSHTIASSSSTPAMLRGADHLTSADEARREYLDTLRDRGPISVPLRLVVRTYAGGDDGSVPPPPFLWLQSGVELGTTAARAWTGSIVVGYSFIPQAYQGIMAEGRVNRLLTGRARSRSRPDLYGFVGAGVMTVWGPATVSFQDRLVSADDVLTTDALEPPRTSFGTLQLGLDLRVGQRMGVSTFFEKIPSLDDSRNLGDAIRPFGIGFQTFGAEVTFWF